MWLSRMSQGENDRRLSQNDSIWKVLSPLIFSLGELGIHGRFLSREVTRSDLPFERDHFGCNVGTGPEGDKDAAGRPGESY